MRKFLYLFLSLSLLMLVSCVTNLNPNVIKAGNGIKLNVDDIRDNWTLLDSVILGAMIPNECPDKTITMVQMFYENPDKSSPIPLAILGVDANTKQIIVVDFYEGDTRYIFGRSCGDTWKQYLPNPNKSV